MAFNRRNIPEEPTLKESLRKAVRDRAVLEHSTLEGIIAELKNSDEEIRHLAGWLLGLRHSFAPALDAFEEMLFNIEETEQNSEIAAESICCIGKAHVSKCGRCIRILAAACMKSELRDSVRAVAYVSLLYLDSRLTAAERASAPLKLGDFTIDWNYVSEARKRGQA